MARHKNALWDPEAGKAYSWPNVPIYILMDIRDELQELNAVFRCRRVQEGFSALRRIAKLNETSFKRRVEAATKKRTERKNK